jgi:hypothetical protein
MPVKFQIDHTKRQINATAFGKLEGYELINYQKQAWSQIELSGYNELFDATEVEEIIDITTEGLRQLASLASTMEASEKPSRLAIIANNDLHFGLGRMYEAFRHYATISGKEVFVFRSATEAEKWLEEKRKPGEKAKF